MTIKAVVHVDDIKPDDSNTWKAYVHIVSLDTDYTAPNDDYPRQDWMWVNSLPASIASTTFQTAIKDAVKARMTIYGSTFGLLDTVSLLGVSLI